MTGYYVVAGPPENIIFKPTYTVMPTDFTVMAHSRFYWHRHCAHISDVATIETDGSYIAETHLSRQDTYFISCFMSLMERLYSG